MKLKQSIIITMAALAAGGWWLWTQHRSQLVAQQAATQVSPTSTPQPKGPLPANVPKMVTIRSKPSGVPVLALSPATPTWSAVQKVLNGQAGYEGRIAAINSLTGRLTADDWAVLKRFLLTPDKQDKDQLGQSIKNRLMDVLCAQTPPPEGLLDVLAKIYRDNLQDDVVRDYAIQHVTAYYEQVATRGNAVGEKEDVESLLWEAVNETSDSIGGTALLALKRLSQEYPNFNQGKIAEAALQMAGNSTASDLTHITAYQVCAQLGVKDALPEVFTAAQNAGTIPEKMSAIAALGLLGGPAQIPFLNNVLAGNENRLKPSAQRALQLISSGTRQTTELN